MINIPRNSIDLFKTGKLDYAGLLRFLAEYDSWQVPTQKDNIGNVHIKTGVYQDDETNRSYPQALLFSDGDAMWKFGQEHNSDDIRGDISKLSTIEFFDLLGNSAEVIDIDLGTETGLRFMDDKVNDLRQAAMAVKLETMLIEEESDPKIFSYLYHYPFFQVFLRETPNGANLLLAPDAMGRQMAAVFTADDCAANFVGNYMKANPGATQPLALALEGSNLFKKLAAMPNLQGIVFNASGPTKPKAFSMELAKLVAGMAKDA